MFEQLRRNTKPIIWFTAIAFVIGFGFIILGDVDLNLGQNRARLVSQGQIGQVNGDPIHAQVYEQLIVQGRMNYQQQTGRELDYRTEIMLRNQAWSDMVQQMILQQEADRRGIKVTDDEIVHAVLNQPPAEVMQNPAFLTNGQFDITKYQALLRNPNFDTRGLEAEYRRSLPTQKLQMQVVGSVTVSDFELWEAYQAQNEKIKVSYLMVPSGKFTVEEDAIGDDVLQRHYQSHRNQYLAPPQAVIRYISVERNYTEEDSLNLIELGRQVLHEHSEGDEFSILVDAYSEAPMELRGGQDAPWFSASDISDPTVRDAAFSLGEGEVSDLLMGRGGLHIVRVDARRTDPEAGDQVRFSDIFLPLEASQETLIERRDSVMEFRQNLEERDFEEVAAEMGFAVRQTQPFTETGFIPGLGAAPEIQDFAFTRAVGAVTPPMDRPEGWIVAQIVERRDERIPEFNELKDRVHREVVDSLRVDQAAAVAQELLSKVRGGSDMAALAESDERVTFDTTDPFSRMGFPRGIGSDPAVIGRLFAADTGLAPEVVRGRNAAFVARVDELIPAEREQFEAQKEQQRQRLLQRKQGLVMNEWMTDLRRKAEIEDYRYGIFEL